VKSFSFVIICMIAFLLPALATAASGATTLNPADPISIRLEVEPRLQAPIQTIVGSTPQLYVITFPEAMNQNSVMKALQAQGNDAQNPKSEELNWEYNWESPQLLRARVTITSSSKSGDSMGEYRLNVNGSATTTNHIITDAPIFTAIARNPSQLWRYAVDGSRRELLASLDEPYSLSKLEKDDRYYLATRFMQYCECDAPYESLYALYDVQEHKLIRYPVSLQTNYRGKGDFVVDRRGFFYEQPGDGVALPQSDTAQTIHIKGYVHGASLSKDGKFIFMAVGAAEQEKDLMILLYSLEDQTTVVLAKTIHGWVPESEVSSAYFPVTFQDVGKQVYFRLIEHEPYGELRYVYSWTDGQITTWKPPFAIEDEVWAGFAASSDDVYRYYANGGLYHEDQKVSDPNTHSDWQIGWINGTHLLAATGSEQNKRGNQQYTSWISLFDADQLTQTKLYDGLYSGSRVIGSSLDGRSVMVSAPNPVLGTLLSQDSFGKAEDKLLAVVTPQKNPLITYYINDQKFKTFNPSLIDSNNKLWIPIREILEAAGWEITWNAKEQTIIGQKMGRTDRVFKFTMDTNKGVFNGKQEKLIYAPKLVKGIAYMNVGILQKLSMKLNWDDTKRFLLMDDIPEMGGITFADGSKYEGDLREEIPSGFGKLFTRQGQLIYDGEFAEGKFHGLGHLYDETGKLIYTGQFNHGERETFPDQ
jgi:hypothetical protein